MKVREIPFDLKAAFNSDAFSFKALETGFQGGRSSLLLELGKSLWIELGETLIVFWHRRFKAYPGEHGKVFVTQEGRHSAYHRLLNTRLIDNVYDRREAFGTMNRTLYPVWRCRMAMAFRDLMNDPSNPDLIKPFYRRLACFETSIGLFGGLTLLERLEECGVEPFRDHAPYYYLWFYHYAEELEHLGEPFEYYQNTFHEELWAERDFALHLRDLNDSIAMEVHCAFAIADKLGLELSIDEIANDASYRKRKALIERHIVPDFRLSEFDERRSRLVKMWDEHYEPLMRKLALEWIDAHRAKKAAA